MKATLGGSFSQLFLYFTGARESLSYPDPTQDPATPLPMTRQYNLQRFIDAQESSYSQALHEIINGRKRTHWMWFIFPQIQGLGYSETSKYFGIENPEEASLYLAHNVLGNRLIEITNALLGVEGKTANQIFGSPDDAKLKSCMTLFSSLEPTNDVFQLVLDTYFDGKKDAKTLRLINE